MYDAALPTPAPASASPFKLSASTFNDRILRTGVPGYYRTGEDKPATNTPSMPICSAGMRFWTSAS